MTEILVVKRHTFEAAHYLYSKDLSNKDNYDLFGKCSGCQPGLDKTIIHGHSYKMEVGVVGVPDTTSGFVINFKDMKNIIEEEVINKFDHKCLNDVIPWEYHPITVENMIKFILEKTNLEERLSYLERRRLSFIKIWETEDSYAEVRR